MQQVERELARKQILVENNMSIILELDAEKKNLLEEREKLVERIQRLKSRKGRFDSNLKFCNACKKDYTEKENFNWSCRTH